MLEVRRANPGDRQPLSRMLELYQHDLSDIWDQDLDALGEYGYALDRYWQDADCHPYVAMVDGHYAGLALVDRQVKVPGGDFWMDQFFILKKYRRKGIATHFARTVFENHRGAWQVGQMPLNLTAQAFWRKVIADYTNGRYTEHQLAQGWWQGFVQCFDSDPHASKAAAAEGLPFTPSAR